MRSFNDGPKSNNWSLEEKREGDGRQAQGRKGCVKTGRGGQDAATSQEAPGPLANTRSWRRGGQASPEPSQGATFWPTPEAGGEEDRPPRSLHREPLSGQHFDLGLPAPELGENTFLLFGAAQPVVILQQHQETHTWRKWEVTHESNYDTNVQDTVLCEPEQGRRTSCRRKTNA